MFIGRRHAHSHWRAWSRGGLSYAQLVYTDGRDEGDEGRVLELVALDCSTRSKCTGRVAPASSTRHRGQPQGRALQAIPCVGRPHLRTRCRPTTTKRGGNVRGRTNFEPVCSICGRDESSAFPVVEASELVTDAKMPHLLCKTCDEAGKKPLVYGVA